MEGYHPSIVEYHSKSRKSHCGYCSSKNGSYTYGLHAHVLKVEDYQNMLDRGWRRCGHYCYKSIMDKTCCPLYTIRCAARDFKLSKTQKKILKRFNHFLSTGTVVKERMFKNLEVAQPVDMFHPNDSKKLDDIIHPIVDMSLSVPSIIEKSNVEQNYQSLETKTKPEVHAEMNSAFIKEKPLKNKSSKAKFLRIERKRLKLQNLGLSEQEIAKKMVEKKKYPIIKTLEDYLNEPLSKSQSHNLKISLVRSYPPSEEFNKTFKVVFDLYKKYQISIHKDEPETVTERQFKYFLVVSPLEASDIYGSYHQQYWLDDKLIAVGVLDILPKCVSSVYFFYDPDYSHLSLGTYGALREVEFTRKLNNQYPDLKFYYMGFYIHSCVKMKYKAAFKPSFLLCPEVYTWHPIQDCLPKLNLSKYSRFNDNSSAIDSNANVTSSDVLILYNRTAMPLGYYLKEKNCSAKEIEEILKYAKLVGKLCSKQILLVRM